MLCVCVFCLFVFVVIDCFVLFCVLTFGNVMVRTCRSSFSGATACEVHHRRAGSRGPSKSRRNAVHAVAQ